jgi:hypothetical protein
MGRDMQADAMRDWLLDLAGDMQVGIGHRLAAWSYASGGPEWQQARYEAVGRRLAMTLEHQHMGQFTSRGTTYRVAAGELAMVVTI